jgi:AcrR family transcriptional regulator
MMAVRPGINKTIVLQAALELANELGLEQVTLALLSKKLNIRTPSLYNHIEGMTGLRKDLAKWGLQKLIERLTDAAFGKSGEDAIHAISVAYLSFVRQYPGMYEATIAAPEKNDTELQALAEDVLNLLFRVLDAFKLERDDALHAVRGLRSIAHGFATLEMKKGFGLALDRDESFRRLVNHFIAGLKNTHA